MATTEGSDRTILAAYEHERVGRAQVDGDVAEGKRATECHRAPACPSRAVGAAPKPPIHSRDSPVVPRRDAQQVLEELREVQPPRPVVLSRRDVRAPQPALRLLRRFDTARGLTRFAILGTLDPIGVFCAIWTALELKAVLRGVPDLGVSFRETIDVAPLACLVVLLLFARGGLYGPRVVRPGFARIVSSLFQVTVVVLLYAVVEGERFNSYYIFTGRCSSP